MKFFLKRPIISLSLLITLTFILLYVTDHYILTVNFYNNSGDPISGIPDQDAQVYHSLQKWIYLSALIYLLIKISMISLILYMGLYIREIEISFTKVLAIVILSEYLFLLPAILKICLFHLEYPNGTLDDWHKFYLLSALSFFRSAPADWYFALQTLNLFEVGYWFLLAFGIHSISGLNYDNSLKIVVLSYVPALIVWVAMITFCSLLLFPAAG